MLEIERNPEQIAAMDEYAKWPKVIRDYWFGEATRLRYIRAIIKWLTISIPEVQKYAGCFAKSKAFVLGMGPSRLRVKNDEWRVLKRHFTVALNYFSVWLQAERGVYYLPSLNLITDYQRSDKEGVPELKKVFENCPGKTMVEARTDNLPHDWVTVCFAKEFDWKIEEGLTVTAMPTKQRWTRTSVAAVHLLALLGFQNIYLLGCDHGPDYYADEVEKANHGYGVLRDHLAERGIRLMNCGEETYVETLRHVRLKDALGGVGDE